MYREFGHVTLKTGEKVQAAVVIGPDLEWAERIEQLLGHKGDIWNWQNSQTLRYDLGIEARYYVLHREGTPFANISAFEHAGVGHFGHVWTKPEDRRKGASSSLMELQMTDFKSRQGKALFLGTGLDSVAYRIYEKFGFRGIERQSGYMAWYAVSEDAFEATYFARGEIEIEPLAWTHWPSSAALFLGDFPCVVRCAPLGLIGRESTEGTLLPLLRDESRRSACGEQPRAMVLRNKPTSAVVGFTVWGWHPLWLDTYLFDVFCHPNYWDKARDLLGSLPLPQTHRQIAYCDANCEQKSRVLSAFGFQKTSTLEDWVPTTRAQTSFLDVAVFRRSP
jgi:ribosomal protein S18 acetylase RimI-like enzyme